MPKASLARFPLIAVLILAAAFSAGCINKYVSTDGGTVLGGMHGSIMDDSGAPLDGVTVRLIGETANYSGRTGSDGTYRITAVSTGEYTVVAEKKGYDNTTVPYFAVVGGHSYSWNATMKPAGSSNQGWLHGTVMSIFNASMADASVTLIGNASNYSVSTGADGTYNFTGVPSGAYGIVVGKPGYRNSSANITIAAGRTYTWNFNIARDCIYYPVNTSVNYALRYGREETTYKGYITYSIAYPEGSTYKISPEPDGSLSQLSTPYTAGNRMLSWKLDNSGGRYSYVKGYLYVDMNGTQTMRLLDPRATSIADASSAQPNYLGREESEGKTIGNMVEAGQVMIDPYDSEIRSIAERVRSEAGSDDAWTVAKALFVWLKNNTYYYHSPESDNYTQSAIEVLHNGRGDCDELSFLYISLCRAVGIPARFIGGYLVEKSPDLYIGHQWAEFYDGEWVPVEVASSENQTFVNGVLRGITGNVTHLLDTRFGIALPDHVKTFVDDGTSQSILGATGRYLYYDTMPTFSPSVYYDAIGYNKMYIASCADGTRNLVSERE